MNARFKELIDELKQNFEYNAQYRELLSDLVEHVTRKVEPSATLAEALNAIQLLKFSREEIEYIKGALEEIISTSQSDEVAGSAIQTLGVFGDPKHSAMFRQKLELYLKRLLRANHPFIACIQALDNCGEQIKDGSSFGIDEVEKNIKSARLYLAKFDKRIPW